MSPDQLVQQAQAAMRRGDTAGAERAYRAIVQRSPSDAAARRQWALLLSVVGQRDLAVQEMTRALAARPGEARWHYDLGDLLTRAGEAERAPEHFARAAELDPAEALYPGRLAMLSWRLRRREEGAAWAEKALAIDPGQEMARITLARARLSQDRLDDAGELAASLAADSRRKGLAANAHHLVGTVRERQGRHDEAFEAHRAGNELLVDTPAARHALAAPIERSLAEFATDEAAASYERWRACSYDDGVAPPVILTGFPRTGTTMVEQMLAAHPAMASADERPLYVGAHRRLGERAMSVASLDGLSAGEILACRGLVAEALAASVAEDQRSLTIVDKHPVRTIELGLVARLFPEARIVFMVRDPRDVVLSAYFQDFEVNPAMVRFLRLGDAARFYASAMAFWLRFREISGLAWTEVRYEDLVTDLEPHARRLVEFVGEPWDDAVLGFHEAASRRVVLSASSEQVTERAHTRSVARWRRHEERLAPVMETLAPFVEAFGYAAG